MISLRGNILPPKSPKYMPHKTAKYLILGKARMVSQIGVRGSLLPPKENYIGWITAIDRTNLGQKSPVCEHFYPPKWYNAIRDWSVFTTSLNSRWNPHSRGFFYVRNCRLVPLTFPGSWSQHALFLWGIPPQGYARSEITDFLNGQMSFGGEVCVEEPSRRPLSTSGFTTINKKKER